MIATKDHIKVTNPFIYIQQESHIKNALQVVVERNHSLGFICDLTKERKRQITLYIPSFCRCTDQ
jgi:hypothetical protein